MKEPTLRAAIVPVTPFQQNCSLVWCPRTGRGAFIDPGGEAERLMGAAREQNVSIEKIFLTHGHLDHAGAAARISRTLGVPVIGPHREDAFLLESIEETSGRYGFSGCENCTPDQWLEDGGQVELGEISLGVRHCPGHTPGHVVFFHDEMKIAFVGDVLFAGSIGRTDFPRGDHGQLLRSITERLWPLGDDMRFVPGHGPMSTFGQERKTNPFVSDHALGKR